MDIGVEVLGGLEVGRKLSELDKAGLDRLVRAADNDIADFAGGAMAAFAPKRTGNLSARGIGVNHAQVRGARNYEARVGLNRDVPYGIWVDQGTGLFGAHHRLITPHTSPLMIWWNAEHGWTRVKHTKGQRGTHFVAKAFELTKRVYVPMRLEKLRIELEALLNRR